jgi:hypothetical protein
MVAVLGAVYVVWTNNRPAAPNPVVILSAEVTESDQSVRCIPK